MVVRLDTMDSTDMVGTDMVHLGMIGDTDREWMIMLGKTETEQILLM